MTNRIGFTRDAAVLAEVLNGKPLGLIIVGFDDEDATADLLCRTTLNRHPYFAGVVYTPADPGTISQIPGIDIAVLKDSLNDAPQMWFTSRGRIVHKADFSSCRSDENLRLRETLMAAGAAQKIEATLQMKSA